MAQAEMWPSWRLLALDVGDARVGLALSDPTGIAVRPLRVIPRRPDARVVAAIQAVIAEEEVVGVVVGLPLSLSGAHSAQTDATLAFATMLREQIPVPLVMWDERYTTVEAERRLREARVPRAQWHARLDAEAAAVILQDYLDAQMFRRGAAHPASPDE